MYDGDSTRTERGKAARKWAGEKFELSERVSQTSELLSSLAKMRTKTRYHGELSIETCDGDVKKGPRTVFHGKSKSSLRQEGGRRRMEWVNGDEISHPLQKHDRQTKPILADKISASLLVHLASPSSKSGYRECQAWGTKAY
ncbi:hypothetical protein SAMN05216299_103163 [Nitrosospira sp. Nsp14]|nr:hypothetical protein SAMN05216299_103163 [Nitrosospira sp. Nsp14]